MFAKPQKEHEWLLPLIGEWNVEIECQMAPDQEMQKSKGTLSCRSLGGLWILAEGKSEGPEGEDWTSIMTVGFDPAQGRYVGTFVASMMTHLWHYAGSVDASGKVLTLDTEGPTCKGEGLCKYQDIITIHGPDHWELSSRILGEDGKWSWIMTGHHRRK